MYRATLETRATSLDDDALALAVGNAAFHSAELYPVLIAFAPRLVTIISDSTVEPKTRSNAALAMGNLLRNGDSNDPVLSQSNACEVLLIAFHASWDILERRVILLSLGNFAGRPGCRKRLLEDHQDKLEAVLNESLTNEDVEINNAARRISEKLSRGIKKD